MWSPLEIGGCGGGCVVVVDMVGSVVSVGGKGRFSGGLTLPDCVH
jgi:hypothetical protein